MHVLPFCLLVADLLFASEAVPLVCQKPNNAKVRYDGPVLRAANGTVLKVTCTDAYDEGNATIICLNGEWSDPQPSCTPVRCPLPEDPQHGFINIKCLDFNCSATHRCPEGKWYKGTVTRYCQRNKTWTGVPGKCEVIRCPILPKSSNGKILQGNRTYLARATVVCKEGYVPSNPHVITCQHNGTWSHMDVNCEEIICPALPNPPNGRVLQMTRTYLTNATMICNEGYVYNKQDSVNRTCTGNSTWSGEEGTCEAQPCPELSEGKSGKLSERRGRYGDTISLHCPSGHVLDGPGFTTCQSDGTWSAKLGQCITSDAHLILIISVGILIVLSVTAAVVVVSRRVPKARTSEEQIPLLGSSQHHISFNIMEDFSSEFSKTDSPEYNIFTSLIREQVIKVIKVSCPALDAELDATITALNKQHKMVFVDILSSQPLDKNSMTSALNTMAIESRADNREYHVKPDSIVFRENVQHVLVADILRKQHSPDKGLDLQIDFDTQYVRLKLLSHTKIGTMGTMTLERPDHYQRALGKTKGKEIDDEELFQKNAKNFILIRGRAGIGKSTLLQRLLWRWANGEWAAKFKVIFMLNLRYLMTIRKEMDLARLLSLYAVYNTNKAGVMIDGDWLRENEGKIGIILDGIDEIQNFKEFWEKKNTIGSVGKQAKPIDWCFALMKNEIMERSTVVVSSRPFAGLSLIGRTFREMGLLTDLMMVELMGLTTERVMEFVGKNVPPARSEFVKQTLSNNPILLSVSAITFYCAALCQVLGDENAIPLKLNTYTQITAYIMQTFIQRSLLDGEEDTLNKSVEETLQLLSKLAFDGLVNGGPGGLPRLVFEKADLDKFGIGPIERRVMRRIGLLVETDIDDPDNPGRNDIFSQFVHLSIQEMLAMVGLLTQDQEKVQKALSRLCRSEQFNMALLFLYGVTFNQENAIIKKISTTIRGTSEQTESIKQALTATTYGISNDLQALQLCHESQSKDIAQKVGSERFGDEISIKGTKLTVIDIIAITFVLKNHRSTHTVRLEHVGMDDSSALEIAQALRDSDSVKSLILNDSSMGDACIKGLMDGVKDSTSLQHLTLETDSVTESGISNIADALTQCKTLISLRLSSDGMTDTSVGDIVRAWKQRADLENLSLASDNITDLSGCEIAAILKTNTHLKELSISSEMITDETMEAVGNSLKSNAVLTELSIQSGSVTGEGVEAVCSELSRNETMEKLWLYGFSMDENGAKAVLGALHANKKLSIMMWPPNCNQDLFSAVMGHNRVHGM